VRDVGVRLCVSRSSGERGKPLLLSSVQCPMRRTEGALLIGAAIAGASGTCNVVLLIAVAGLLEAYHLALGSSFWIYPVSFVSGVTVFLALAVPLLFATPRLTRLTRDLVLAGWAIVHVLAAALAIAWLASAPFNL
jgi:hypothetical protein